MPQPDESAEAARTRQATVAAHYDGDFFAFEEQRLTRPHHTEYAITTRYLTRFIQPGSTVADIGVGVGHYAALLASRGCQIHLVDISRRLLDAATARLTDAGQGAAILSAACASVTDLAHLESGSCDVVLLLGPLYHLVTLPERQQAVAEAARILTGGGLMLAAGINRLAFPRDAFQDRPETGHARYAVRRALYESGQFDADAFLSYSHLTTVAEFRALFAEQFTETTFVGVESFVSPHRPQMAQLSDEDAQAWLDLVELTGTTIEGIGQSDHFLYIGRKS
ncbi:MAG: class I SAM-dependent methyltransferase [Chloroflexi bacterium]|nr:class I SAM-dependent methyltransferase [Chloroflexota bacterium]